MNAIIKAAAFARLAHDGQRRKYNGRPYISHPARVSVRTARLPNVTGAMIVAAWLHDVVEDTDANLIQIQNEFGWTVSVLVNWLTNPSKQFPTWLREKRKRLDREHLAKAPKEAKQIKMIDRIDNLQEMHGCSSDFADTYAAESVELAHAIGSADEILRVELIEAADYVCLMYGRG